MNGTRTMMLTAVTPPSGSHADATEIMDQADQSRHPQSDVGASSLSELSANSLILLILAKPKKPIKSAVYELTPTGC